MTRSKCKWLRITEVSGYEGEAGRILGTCDLLGGTAYEPRCEYCECHEVVRR